MFALFFAFSSPCASSKTATCTVGPFYTVCRIHATASSKAEGLGQTPKHLELNWGQLSAQTGHFLRDGGQGKAANMEPKGLGQGVRTLVGSGVGGVGLSC